MEIFLQGAKAYGIKDWEGRVEVSQFKVFQYKRIANSRDSVSLFRKVLKVFKSPDPPVVFPEGFDPANLALGDFLQILVAVAASHERSIQKTFACQHCKTLNPRVIDILKVFQPIAAGVPEGRMTIPLRHGAVDGGSKAPQEEIQCKYTTVGEYLAVNAYIEGLLVTSGREDLQKKIIPELTARFGDVYRFEDEEDVADFREIFEEFGLLAKSIEYAEKSFEDKFKWLLTLKGDKIEFFKRLDAAIDSLTPKLKDVYTDKCSKCGKEIRVKLNPSEYFFVTP